MDQKVTYESRDANAWSFVFTLVWLGACAGSMWYLARIGVDFYMTSWEFVLLALAVFRLIRLSTYDTIAQFLRDWFMDTKWEYDDATKLYRVTRTKPIKGLRRELYELFACPWCIGVWLSLGLVFAFFAYPPTLYLVLILAVAGLASIVQILSNLIGWYAEGRKIEVKNK